jgi:hypothetical protein
MMFVVSSLINLFRVQDQILKSALTVRGVDPERVDVNPNGGQVDILTLDGKGTKVGEPRPPKEVTRTPSSPIVKVQRRELKDVKT